MTNNLESSDGGLSDGAQQGASRVAARIPARVLVAEDDTDMRALIKDALSEDGYKVIEAADGLEALNKLQEALWLPLAMPDVIVMDVVMPRYSGLGILGALRRANWATPVIVISSIDDDSIRKQAKDLGAAAYFKKPFDIDDLRTAVINASLLRAGARVPKAWKPL